MSSNLPHYCASRSLCRAAVLLSILFAIFIFNNSAFGQNGQPPLITVQGEVGHVAAPGVSATLTVLVTDRTGTPTGGAPVLFVAPESGPSGYFPTAQQLDQTYIHVAAGGNGIASASFVTGSVAGVFLVEARVVGTSASTTFAFTVAAAPVAPPLSAAAARAGVLAVTLGGAVLDETLRLHGPVLLETGTRVTPAVLSNLPSAFGPLVTRKRSWLLWIDDAPLARFAHSVRYVLVDASDDSGEALDNAEVWDESWWPSVFLPGAQRPIALIPPYSSHGEIAEAAGKSGASAAGQKQAGWPAPRRAPTDACAILIFGPGSIGARKDVRDYQKYLQDNDLVAPGNILTNDKVLGDTTHQVPASKADVQDLINKAKARGCRTVYWVYSGHGEAAIDGGGVVLNDPAGGPAALPYDELAQMLQGLGQVELRAVEDACYSGQFVEWLQGRGFTGQVVSAADTDHMSWDGRGGGEFTQGLLGELGKMDNPDLEEALRRLGEHSDPSGLVHRANPQGSPVDPHGMRKMAMAFVFVPSPGQRRTFRIRRPLDAAATAVLGGELTVASQAIAGFADSHVTFPEHKGATAIGVARDNGLTRYEGAVSDWSTNQQYEGSNGFQVGTFKFSDAIVTLPVGTSAGVQIDRYGITMDHEIGPRDNRTRLALRSRDPGIADPDQHWVQMRNDQITMVIDIQGVSPGETIVDVSDWLTRTVKGIKVIVVAQPPVEEKPPQTIDPMDGNISYNPSNHPFSNMHTRCTLLWASATSFLLRCLDPNFLDITATFDPSNNTFQGKGQGRVLGSYNVHAKVMDGRFNAAGQNHATGMRAAAFDSVQFTYELGSNGGFPGGQPIRWKCTGPIPPSGGCSYSLNPTELTVTRVGTTGWVTLASPAGCAWTAVSNASWIRILGPASGTGSDTLSFQYLPNHDQDPRIGTLTIGGQTFTLTQEGQSSQRPVILAAVHGASFNGGIPQGSWTTITGAGLAPTTRIWGSADFAGDHLPTQLDGVSATINGKPAYIYYISPTQLNVLGEDQDVEGPLEIQVTNREGTSNMITAISRRLDPALFLFDPEGRKYAAAVHADGTYLGKVGLFEGATTRPAKPGDIILLYGTGFGSTDPPTPAGLLVQAPARCANPVVVRIGGENAAVLYAGKTGSGLYQFNVVVPALPDGDHEVRLYVNGFATPAGASITVQR